ncbi:MAG: Mov34/MPN/PAD-1 family protein [Peptoniphilaceae bacterium]
MKIDEEVLMILERYIQKGSTSLEAGGVLIGKENYSNKDIVITYATEPFQEDKQTYNRFYRRDKAHVKCFNDLYKSSDGTLRYIGEWHTHPEAYPNYSYIDVNNWFKIKRKGPDKVDYYHLIIGYEAIRVWKLENKAIRTRLVATIQWKEIY